MAYDLEQYRQRLRQATGTGPMQQPMDAVNAIPPPTVGPMDAAAQAPAQMPARAAARPATMEAAAAPQPAQQAQPAQAQPAPGKPGEKPKIPVGPPNFKPEFDQKQITTAKTAADVMQAMKPESKKEYLDWWEGRYGAVEKKYSTVLQELGKAPDPRRKMSREEMFDMLLDFGLNMIKSSQNNGLGTSIASSIGGAVAGHKGRREAEKAKHSGMVRQTIEDRAAEMKEIGSYGDALKGQGELEMRGAEKIMREEQMKEAQTRRQKMEGEAPETMDTDAGTAQWDAETKTWKRATMDGQNITRKTVQGSGRGSGGGRDTRVAEQKRYDHLISLNVEPELALRLSYKVKSGDPEKDRLAIYRDVLKASFGDKDKAKEVSDAWVTDRYGDNAESPGSAPILPKNDDPLGIRNRK